MKGYCVDVRGFNAEKKKLIADTIDDLLGYEGSRVELETVEKDKYLNYITSVDVLGNITEFSLLKDYVTSKELQHEISFEDLMELYLVNDNFEGFNKQEKYDLSRLSASRITDVSYSKEEFTELESKIEALEEKCKRLEDTNSDLKSFNKELITLVSSKIEDITKLRDQLVWYKTTTFAVSLITFSYFFVKVLLM